MGAHREIRHSNGTRFSTKQLIALSATAGLYFLLLTSAYAGTTDRAAAAAVLILGVYLSLRPRSVIHPATPVFLNYLIYVCMPYTLFWVYRTWQIDYILPWGLLNDWSALSNESIWHFEITFLTFYFSLYFLASNHGNLSSTLASHRAMSRGTEVHRIGIIALALAIVVGCAVFLRHTGGVSAWLTNYSYTYINNRAGAGLLNYFLVQFAHVLAFVAGWMVWRGRKRFPISVWVLILIALAACTVLQGIKSRIPVLLFFFLIPRLTSVVISAWKGATIVAGLISFFMVSMYFRSEGFYSTPRMAVEYLQSYFNTLFLHDLAIRNFEQGEFPSILMGLRKYGELFGDKIPREQYDLSVALTQRFFPASWYQHGATQQWPIETDLFLSFPVELFWLVPIVIYASLVATLYRTLPKGSPIALFIYAAEFVRMMSVFRSGLLTWSAILQVLFYGTVYLYCTVLLFRRVASRADASRALAG